MSKHKDVLLPLPSGTGTDGDDFIYGGLLPDADNSINGLGGNDFIWGEFGADTMMGGDGANTFYFENWQEADKFVSGAWVSNGDRIGDFKPGVDKIQIGIGYLSVVGTATFEQVGANEYIGHFSRVDPSGAWSFDEHITTVGPAPPTADDVVWASR